jgi:hypothetical protein
VIGIADRLHSKFVVSLLINFLGGSHFIAAAAEKGREKRRGALES